MKFLFYFNAMLVGFTGLAFAISAVSINFLGIAIWLTVALGFFQVVTGFLTYLFHFKNLWLLAYLLGVALFFFLLEHGFTNIWTIPTLLALYFTFVLYNIQKSIL